jgi:exonuclease III
MIRSSHCVQPGYNNGTWIVNIYNPSGEEKKNKKETFYNTDLTYIQPTTHADMILAGDLN